MFEDDMAAVDFARSKVFITEFGRKKLQEVYPKDYQEFLKVKQTIATQGFPKMIRIEQTGILKDVKADFMMLTDVEGGVQYVVSEQLRDIMVNLGCTGIDYQPLQLDYAEWRKNK